MAAELLPLALLQVDADHQAREGMNEETIAAYTAHLIEGGDLPPVVAFRSDDGVWLGDGFHRRAAYQRAERTTIPADVRKGGKREAFIFALGANADHGLRRTNADLRRAVTLALQDPELGQLGDRALAKVCNVSHPFVGRIRAALKKPESSLDEVDLWEGERDPEAQVRRVLDCYDVAECEALLGAAGCVVREHYQTSRHRRDLRQVARAKLHADVSAALVSGATKGLKDAAIKRSREIALFDRGATGDEVDTLTKPAAWAKVLQFKDLPADARWIGLIAQVVKPTSWGIEREHLLTLLPDCAFKTWVTEAAKQKNEEYRAQHAATSPQTVWPSPKFGSPEQAEREAALLAWIKSATPELLRQFWVWSHYRQDGYGVDVPWHGDDVVEAARATFAKDGQVTDCPDPDCAGFCSPQLMWQSSNIGKHDGFCWVCHEPHENNGRANAKAINRVAGLIARGWVTAAELGIEAAPVEASQVETLPPADVEAAPIVEAPQVETLPPADVEADVEAPRYRVAWGAEAEPAKTLCGRIQRAFKDEKWDKDSFFGAYDAWAGERVVPSPLVKWVPVFDVVGRWLNSEAMVCDVHEAARELMPGAPLTPPAVSDTEAPPIAFEDRDLWASCPLARTAFKKLLAYSGKLRKQDFTAARDAAKSWKAAGESIPPGMPIEVQAVIEALASDNTSKEQVQDLLHAAHRVGKITLRWINNAEEDEPVPSTPTGRSSRPTKAAKAAELGAAAK